MRKVRFCVFAILITISFAYPNLISKRDFFRAMKNQGTDSVAHNDVVDIIKLLTSRNCWHQQIVYSYLESVKDPTHIFGLKSVKNIAPEKNDHTGDDHVGSSDINGFGSKTSFLDDPFYFDENYYFWNKFRLATICDFMGHAQSRRSSYLKWTVENGRSCGGRKVPWNFRFKASQKIWNILWDFFHSK